MYKIWSGHGKVRKKVRKKMKWKGRQSRQRTSRMERWMSKML